MRAGLAGIEVYPSRAVLGSSVTVLLAGGYLLTVGLLARVVERIGGPGNLQFQAFAVLLGMALGALVGMVSIGGFRLGLSGGVLLVGIFAGRMGKIGPVVFTITAQANHVLKRLGLILFMAALGTTSGDGILDSLTSSGGMYVLVSAAAILAVLLAVMLLARFVMRRNAVEVMAICAGSVACTPAMEMATAKVGRDDAMVLYASIYPMGLMMPVFFMQILITFQRGLL